MPQSRVLRERVAGQSAMAHVVAVHSAGAPRTPLAAWFGRSPLPPGSRASYRAAVAELVAGDALEGLGPSWDLLHDLPLTDGLLDHLAIGPAGVFAIRTMHADGSEVVVAAEGLAVAGEPSADVALAQAAAAEVSATLGAPVQPLVVVVGARRLSRRGDAGVLVLASAELWRMLGRAPRALSGDEVARLSDLADLESTWPRAGAGALDTQALHRDFAVIRAQVNQARGRRALWAAAGFGLAYGAVWSLIAALVSLMAGA